MVELEKPDQETGTNSSIDASHLDDIQLDDPEITVFRSGDCDDLDGAGDVDPGVLTPDQFYAGLKSVFDMCGVIPVAPLPLTSMPIRPGEEAQARAASDALYEIAEESPWLRFLIEPQSKWVQRMMVIGVFVGGKGMAVRAEIVARQPAPKSPPKPASAKPANTNREPAKPDRDPQPSQEMPVGYQNEVLGGQINEVHGNA